MIAIIDYGLGNLGSISNMLKVIGEKSRITNDIADIVASDGIILPGVGAFDAGMNMLETKGLISVITEQASLGKPIDAGCVLISQHSDNTTPATTAEKNGKFHTGYNADMISAAPAASIISTRIDWTNYFVYAIKAVANGEEFDQDYSHGMAEGDVVMTTLNEDICAAGTAEKMEEVMAQISAGELEVFDTATFTVDGETVTSFTAIDMDGDFVPDEGEAISDGVFHESQYPGLMSAPYFNMAIDGIERLNEAY